MLEWNELVIGINSVHYDDDDDDEDVMWCGVSSLKTNTAT